MEVIGSGSYGTVYHKSNAVVIKKLKGESTVSKDRFLKEAKLLFGIKHKKNIPILIGFTDGPILMMEYGQFNFRLFGLPEKTVSNLGDFYDFINHEWDIECFADVLVVCIKANDCT